MANKTNMSPILPYCSKTWNIEQTLISFKHGYKSSGKVYEKLKILNIPITYSPLNITCTGNPNCLLLYGNLKALFVDPVYKVTSLRLVTKGRVPSTPSRGFLIAWKNFAFLQFSDSICHNVKLFLISTSKSNLHLQGSSWLLSIERCLASFLEM